MNSTKYTYDYPRPAVTCDVVLFGYDGSQLHVLLIERGLEPYRGHWALPGGFMRMDESLEQCAARELHEETGVSLVDLKQIGAFSSVHRDPRGRVITVAFLGLVNKSHYRLLAGDDAADAQWFMLEALPPLAFDHDEIIYTATRHLRDMVATTPAVLKLLDRQFSLAELQRVVELITGQQYDRRNFQRRILQSDAIVPAPDAPSESTGGRNATMYALRPELELELEAHSAPVTADTDCCEPCACEPCACEPEFDAAAFMANRGNERRPKPKKSQSRSGLLDFFKF